MIYRQLANIYGDSIAEEILLHAMSLLGRLPHSQFALRERETCPRVSCPFSTVWFSYLDKSEENWEQCYDQSDEPDELFTIQLLTGKQLSLVEFSSSCLEAIAVEIERHERTMRASQAKMLVDEQMGFETGIIRKNRRMC